MNGPESDKDRFAIDLLWLRVGEVGGSESFIRNLLDGMQNSKRKYRAVLLVSKDNHETLQHYLEDDRFQMIICPVNSDNIRGRLLYQNVMLRGILRRNQIDKVFEPVYSMPFMGTRGVSYYTVIHDLQIAHYPQYGNRMKNLWMMASWKNAVKKSKAVVAISDATRADIIEFLGADPRHVIKIYNPVYIEGSILEEEERYLREYGLEKDRYYFCVASLLPHKNLMTLIRVMCKDKTGKKLIITGVGGRLEEALKAEISRRHLSDKVRLLPFVEDRVRDTLYRNCSVFLFPSVFEGFGMPPVEAMLLDKPVITTKCASIPEVTKGEALYVDDPYDEEQWIERINKVLTGSGEIAGGERRISPTNNPYKREVIAEEYLDLLCG